MERLRVVLSGRVRDGFEPTKARSQLAVLIRKDEVFAQRLLTGQATIVRSSLDLATAKRYVEALSAIGVDCRLEAENLEFHENVDAGELGAPSLAPGSVVSNFLGTSPDSVVSNFMRTLAEIGSSSTYTSTAAPADSQLPTVEPRSVYPSPPKTAQGGQYYESCQETAKLSEDELWQEFAALGDRYARGNRDLAHVWGVAEESGWVSPLIFGANAMTTRRGRFQLDLIVVERLRRSVPILENAIVVSAAILNCVIELEERSSLTDLVFGPDLLRQARSGPTQMTNLLKTTQDALATLPKGAVANAQRHPGEPPAEMTSPADVAMQAALAEVGRQKSIWFGKDFTRARALLQEAHLLGHPEATAREAELPIK